jgi:hypothetical protein
MIKAEDTVARTITGNRNDNEFDLPLERLPAANGVAMTVFPFAARGRSNSYKLYLVGFS